MFPNLQGLLAGTALGQTGNQNPLLALLMHLGSSQGMPSGGQGMGPQQPQLFAPSSSSSQPAANNPLASFLSPQTPQGMGAGQPQQPQQSQQPQFIMQLLQHLFGGGGGGGGQQPAQPSGTGIPPWWPWQQQPSMYGPQTGGGLYNAGTPVIR